MREKRWCSYLAPKGFNAVNDINFQQDKFQAHGRFLAELKTET